MQLSTTQERCCRRIRGVTSLLPDRENAMSDTVAQSADLDSQDVKRDADFFSMLERVSFQAGVMMGAEALDAEQSYHRRRLNRHQRFLAGSGTVFGLAVGIASAPRPGGAPDITVTVAQGYAIDGLGREILVPETYSISLVDWLAARNRDDPAGLASALANGTLFLTVTVRGQALATGLTPTAAPVFDAGIDPVVASRVGDSFLLELRADATKAADAVAGPFGAWTQDRRPPVAADVPGPLSARETQFLATITDVPTHNVMALHAWLLHRTLPAWPDAPGIESVLDDAARIVLASVHVATTNVAQPPALADVTVNNLVRPFVRPNALLAAIAAS
jgi:hypothetical protein